MLCDLFTYESCDTVFSFSDVNDTVQCFIAVLRGLLEYIAPMRKIRLKQNFSPWTADADVVAACCQRDKLNHQSVATGDSVIWQQYRSSRNKVNKLAKCTYLSKLASSKLGQSAKFWKYFCHLSRRGAQNILFTGGFGFYM